MSFGFSVGDFLSVGSLAYRIITALGDSRGSKAEYKGLISVLSSLQHTVNIVSTHFIGLVNSGGVDAALCNGIKHQLGLCTAAMEEFLHSSQKYTESLLPNDRRMNFRDEFRKITWCLFKKDDVQKLHSTLERHIQAFLMLANAVTGQSLVQTKQLALQSHAMTERMEQQLIRLTEKFRVFNSVVDAPPRSLGYTWEGGWAPDQAPIIFEDALGRFFKVPLVFCRSMNVFHETLKILFMDVPGQRRVAQGEYEMMDGSEGSIIQDSNWQFKVIPGEHIAMNIVLRIPSNYAADLHVCPKCETPNQRVKPIQGILRCLHCQLCFRVSQQERIAQQPNHMGQEKPKLDNIGPAAEKNPQKEEDAFRRVHYLREIEYQPPQIPHILEPDLPLRKEMQTPVPILETKKREDAHKILSAKHFEQLSREFRKEKAREKYLMAARAMGGSVTTMSSWPINEANNKIWGAFEEMWDEEPSETTMEEVLPKSDFLNVSYLVLGARRLETILVDLETFSWS